MKISAVLIVKNEEEMLRMCLASVHGVDEIIVVDTGSIDKTIKVALAAGAKVYDDFKWCDSFAKARNHALAKATGDWVLSIDADEVLHNFSKVREAVELAEAAGAKAVSVKMVSEAMDPKTGAVQTFFFPRLFKRCPEVWWEGAIHNTLSIVGQHIGDVAITFGHSPAHRLDPNRAMRILEKEVASRPDATREMFYLGREYWYKNRYEDAVAILQRYVNQPHHFMPEKAEGYLTLARCLWALHRGEDARQALLNAILINPNFKEALLFMADMSWPKQGNVWRKFANIATGEDVLFNRTI